MIKSVKMLYIMILNDGFYVKDVKRSCIKLDNIILKK